MRVIVKHLQFPVNYISFNTGFKGIRGACLELGKDWAWIWKDSRHLSPLIRICYNFEVYTDENIFIKLHLRG